MRKVIYRRFISAKYSKGNMLPDEGTGVFEEKMTHIGYFHQWVYGYETGPLAIVENEEGLIEEVLYSNLKFISPVK